MFENEIRAGATLLDERGPDGWRERVNPETLTFSAEQGGETMCVLGQAYGTHWRVGKTDLDISLLEMSSYGFACADFARCACEVIVGEWKAYLRGEWS